MSKRPKILGGGGTLSPSNAGHMRWCSDIFKMVHRQLGALLSTSSRLSGGKPLTSKSGSTAEVINWIETDSRGHEEYFKMTKSSELD